MKRLRPSFVRVHRPRGGYEIGRLDLAVVDGLDDRRIRHEWPERLHHVEREGRPAVARLVIETPVRVEADGGECDSPGAHQQGIGIGQERIDGIERRAAVSRREIKSEGNDVVDKPR